MTATQPNPMEILGRISPAGARSYMEHRAAIMENPELAALPLQTKLLVGIGVAAGAPVTLEPGELGGTYVTDFGRRLKG